MRFLALTWLLMGALNGGASLAVPNPAKPHYHCICGEICAKAAPKERCEVRNCDGRDERRSKAGKAGPK
jgi:hypothetical protein